MVGDTTLASGSQSITTPTAGRRTARTWQHLIGAAVFELCLVGAMVAFELLGQDNRRCTPISPGPSAQIDKPAEVTTSKEHLLLASAGPGLTLRFPPRGWSGPSSRTMTSPRQEVVSR
jgi:hypothetical protein